MSSVHLIASYDSFHFVQFRQCLNYIVFPIVTVLFISIDVVLYFSRFFMIIGHVLLLLFLIVADILSFHLDSSILFGVCRPYSLLD